MSCSEVCIFFCTCFFSGYVGNFPASGYRSNGNGEFVNLATNGYSWPSSPYGVGSLSNRCGLLNFNSTNLNPLNNGNRGAAVPVRCVQELTGLVLG